MAALDKESSSDEARHAADGVDPFVLLPARSPLVLVSISCCRRTLCVMQTVPGRTTTPALY